MDADSVPTLNHPGPTGLDPRTGKKQGGRSSSDRTSGWRGEQGSNRKILAWPTAEILFTLKEIPVNIVNQGK